MECEIYLSKALTNKLINQAPAPSLATQVTETKQAGEGCIAAHCTAELAPWLFQLKKTHPETPGDHGQALSQSRTTGHRLYTPPPPLYRGNGVGHTGREETCP